MGRRNEQVDLCHESVGAQSFGMVGCGPEDEPWDILFPEEIERRE